MTYTNCLIAVCADSPSLCDLQAPDCPLLALPHPTPNHTHAVAHAVDICHVPLKLSIFRDAMRSSRDEEPHSFTHQVRRYPSPILANLVHGRVETVAGRVVHREYGYRAGAKRAEWVQAGLPPPPSSSVPSKRRGQATSSWSPCPSSRSWPSCRPSHPSCRRPASSS